MTKLSKLKILIKKAEQIDKDKNIEIIRPKQNPFSRYVGTAQNIKRTTINTDMYNNWKTQVFEFLEHNNLTGFLSTSYMGTNGVYDSFFEQFQNLKKLNELSTFLNVKLNFKIEHLEKYLLQIMIKNDPKLMNYVDYLGLVFDNSAVNETLQRIQTEELTNLKFRFGANGDRLFSCNTDSYLTLTGKKLLQSLQSPKFIQLLKHTSLFMKIVLTILLGSGLVISIYYTNNIVTNNVEIRDATISGDIFINQDIANKSIN